MSKPIKIGKGEDEKRFNPEWFKTVSEKDAIRLMKHEDSDTIRKVWKIANGLSTPNYTKSEDKPKRKRVQKKKEN